MIKISKELMKKLISIHRHLQKGRERDKIKAIFMLASGYSQKEVSRVLLVDEDTVSAWNKKYENSQHYTDWLFNGYKGYQGKLTANEKKEVDKYVTENTISDSKKVQAFIADKIGKKYSQNGVIALLHNLKFSYKKTTLIPSKYDAEKQAEFKESYEKLEKELPKEEVIGFVDAVPPQHNTVCHHAWIKKGKIRQIKSNTGRVRINLNGFYNPLNQDILEHQSTTINAETTIAFFRKIEEFYPDKTKIHLMVDNARYYKNQKVTKYLTEGSRIQLKFLPPYSPNCNLIERLWKYLKKEVINNKYYETFKEFQSAVLNFFEKCKDEGMRRTIKQFIGSSLHLLDTT